MILKTLLILSFISLLVFIQSSDLKDSLAKTANNSPQIQLLEDPTPKPTPIVLTSLKPSNTQSLSTPSAKLIKKATSSTVKKVVKTQTQESKLKETNKSFTQELFEALNNYRAKNGQGSLSLDSKLTDFSNTRLQTFISIGNIDNHGPFNALLNSDGFNLVGFWALAENSSVNSSPKSAQEIIENIFGQSPGHNANQLNPNYSHVGIAANETFTNFVFGGDKK